MPEGLASPALALHVWFSVRTTLFTPLPCKGVRPSSRVPPRGGPTEATPSMVPCPGMPRPCTICLPGADLPLSSWSLLTEPEKGPQAAGARAQDPNGLRLRLRVGMLGSDR